MSGTSGSFAQADVAVWRGGDEAALADVRLFGQVGWADQMVSSTGLHLSAGLLATGRAGHGAGVFLTHADLSDVTGSPFDGDETAVEIFGIMAVTPYLTVQPDIQYLIQPSGNVGSKPVLV